MIARRGAPKLALNVPALTISATTTAKSSLPPISPATNSPTGRNTRLNQRGLSTIQPQPPTFSYSQSTNTKSILKKGQSSRPMSSKELSFSEEPVVRSIEKLPQECYGEYVKMSRDERRWGKGN